MIEAAQEPTSVFGEFDGSFDLNFLDLALVTYAAETFTEIGMKVKAAFPARYTLFASVSDGCISYLHTAESHPEGGYEVDVAPLAYRYPGRLQASCEEIALDTTGKMLENLWNQV